MRTTIIAALAAAALILGVSATSAQDAMTTPKGATINAKVDATLTSKTNKNDDKFTLTPYDPLFGSKHPELKGAKIEGHLANVSPAGPTHKATMNMVFDDVKYADGTVVPANLTLKSMSIEEPKTHHMRDVMVIAGSAVGGKMVGDKMGHKGGTLAGTAAGFALVSAMKSDVNVKRGTSVKILVNAPLADTPAAH